jgi:hypothetical protein
MAHGNIKPSNVLLGVLPEGDTLASLYASAGLCLEDSLQQQAVPEGFPAVGGRSGVVHGIGFERSLHV